jgi:hypothetical protein
VKVLFYELVRNHVQYMLNLTQAALAIANYSGVMLDFLLTQNTKKCKTLGYKFINPKIILAHIIKQTLHRRTYVILILCTYLFHIKLNNKYLSAASQLKYFNTGQESNRKMSKFINKYTCRYRAGLYIFMYIYSTCIILKMFRACLGQRSAFFLYSNPLLFHPCLSVPNVCVQCTRILHKLQYSKHVGHKKESLYNVHTRTSLAPSHIL